MRFGLARVKRCSMVASTSCVSCGEALAMLQAIGRPWRSAIAMILLPFPRRVGPIAGLVGRITVGQIVPRSTGAQNPKNSVQHGSRIAPGPTTTVGTSLGSEQGLEDLPLRLGQVHALDLR